MLLQVKNISLSFGGVQALTNVEVNVEKDSLHALIGPNGSGKTCLFNVISGIYKPQRGKILFKGRDISYTKPYQRAEIGLGRTFQNIELFGKMSVLDNFMLGRHIRFRSGAIASLVWVGRNLREELEHREWVESIIDLLEIERWRNHQVDTLPYGIQKRVELGRAMSLDPEILLLDEPCAGMNVEETEDIVRFILDINEEWHKTVLLVEHDMGVVMDICDTITVLEFGSKIAEGLPKEIQENQKVINAYLGENVDIFKLKETEVDKIEVVSQYSVIQVRTATVIKKDGVEISRSYHRHIVQPGDDLTGQDPKVVAIANAVHTPEIINNR